MTMHMMTAIGRILESKIKINPITPV